VSICRRELGPVREAVLHLVPDDQKWVLREIAMNISSKIPSAKINICMCRPFKKSFYKTWFFLSVTALK
jgi:hypothetical protein